LRTFCTMRFNSTIALSLSFCFAGCISIKSSDNCERLRTGKFIQYMYNSSGMGHWTKITLFIERNDSIQVVTQEYPFRDTQIFRIKWLDRCKYNLLWTNPQTSFDSAYAKASPNGTTYRIIKQTSNYVLVRWRNQVDTIWNDYR
jgi:hypothetical protein